ncbi:hypothetical protein OIU84_015029 [Salix udensis]|uniref:GDSL esterase/lipase n=1 Tax=Salix udensis TaxID=889485 RepID=A0AAD6NRN6_9ROSI|nr:hypothetical protein OIU84_015029 [Salix udensis]
MGSKTFLKVLYEAIVGLGFANAEVPAVFYWEIRQYPSKSSFLLESLILEQGRLVLSVGCCPTQRVFNESGGCLEGLNDLALEFHSTIDALLMKLGSEYTDRKYSLGNTYEMSINLIDNPFPFVELTIPISSDHSSGFKEVQTACCGITRFNGEGICDKNANLCLNRHEYLFWDLFHPTMTASKLAALTLYAGEPRFVSPINFKQLAEA